MQTFVGRALRALAFTVLLSLVASAAFAASCGVTAPNVTTAQYNSYRTSANLAERTLSPATVQTGFGYLGALAPSDGLIYAQPLILHNLTVSGACYATVVFVATMENKIYAFDGDNLVSTVPIWKSKPFTTAVASGSVSYPALYCKSNVGFTNAGILSTPVIDLAQDLMYFVTLNDTKKVAACTSTGSSGWVYTLHAMSLKNDSTFGLDYIPAHDISADLQPYGFVPGQQLQRPSLAGIAGSVLIGFGFGTSSNAGSELSSDYQGWMAEYSSCAMNSTKCNASTCYSNTNCTFFLSSATTPGPLAPVGAGVWMSGVGPATDGTFYAYSTGNGCRPKSSTTITNCMALTDNALGDSVLYIPHGENSNPGSTFTPENSTETPGYENYYVDDFNDLDVSTAGVMMIPPAVPGSTSSYLVASGKAGQTYLLQTANLGGYTATPYQSFLSAASVAPCAVPFPVSPQTPIYSGIVPWKGGCAEVHNPAYWTLTGSTGFYFVWGFGDVPRGYFFDGSYLDINASDPEPPLAGTMSRGGGGALAISENGSDQSTAVLWGVTSDGFSSSGAFLNGSLVAFQLYGSGGRYEIVPIFDSQTASGQVFTAQRYVVPVVNNGKVYVSTLTPSNNGRIYIYGPCSLGPNGGCGTQPAQ
jgi:hypothetical protein